MFVHVGLECLTKLNMNFEALKWIDEADASFTSTTEMSDKRKQIERKIKIENKEKRRLEAQLSKIKKDKLELLTAFKVRVL